MRIIFVCTANICRSVMAEGILKKLLSTRPNAHHIEIQSFGIDVLVGLTPDRNSREICLAHDIDIGSHTAQQLTKETLKQSDFIFCMEKEQKQLILSAYPEFVGKTFLLKEYQAYVRFDEVSIKDPTGRSKRHYKACFNEIEREIQRIADLIIYTETN
jgi:protein-tyrosine-phosphatase